MTPPNIEAWTDGTQFRYGSRVPCLVLGPYAKAGYISKTLHSFVSLARFVEENFGISPINQPTARPMIWRTASTLRKRHSVGPSRLWRVECGCSTQRLAARRTLLRTAQLAP